MKACGLTRSPWPRRQSRALAPRPLPPPYCTRRRQRAKAGERRACDRCGHEDSSSHGWGFDDGTIARTRELSGRSPGVRQIVDVLRQHVTRSALHASSTLGQDEAPSRCAASDIARDARVALVTDQTGSRATRASALLPLRAAHARSGFALPHRASVSFGVAPPIPLGLSLRDPGPRNLRSRQRETDADAERRQAVPVEVRIRLVESTMPPLGDDQNDSVAGESWR